MFKQNHDKMSNRCPKNIQMLSEKNCPEPLRRQLPKNLFRVILNLLPCKAKITLRGQNNLGNVSFMLVLKSLFGGSLKITLQNRNSPKG